MSLSEDCLSTSACIIVKPSSNVSKLSRAPKSPKISDDSSRFASSEQPLSDQMNASTPSAVLVVFANGANFLFMGDFNPSMQEPHQMGKVLSNKEMAGMAEAQKEEIYLLRMNIDQIILCSPYDGIVQLASTCVILAAIVAIWAMQKILSGFVFVTVWD